MPYNIYIYIYKPIYIYIQSARNEVQAPNTTKIYIQQMYIYSRLPLSVKWPKLRTTGLVDVVILHAHNKQLEIYGVTNS